MVSPGQRSAAGCANLKWFEKQEWLAAVIPLWFHLHLPSCSPRFKSQAHHLRFCQFVLVKLCNEKRTKINKKRPGLSHLFFEKARVVEKLTIVLIQYFSLEPTGSRTGQEDCNFVKSNFEWKQTLQQISAFLKNFRFCGNFCFHRIAETEFIRRIRRTRGLGVGR